MKRFLIMNNHKPLSFGKCDSIIAVTISKKGITQGTKVIAAIDSDLVTLATAMQHLLRDLRGRLPSARAREIFDRIVYEPMESEESFDIDKAMAELFRNMGGQPE